MGDVIDMQGKPVKPMARKTDTVREVVDEFIFETLFTLLRPDLTSSRYEFSRDGFAAYCEAREPKPDFITGGSDRWRAQITRGWNMAWEDFAKYADSITDRLAARGTDWTPYRD